MGMNCQAHASQASSTDPVFRRVLWMALLINLTMFGIELAASKLGDSLALQADALDFFADSANYAISLFVVGMSIAARAKASLIKAASMGALGIYILLQAVSKALYGSEPQAITMGLIAMLALVANLLVALMLYRFRNGDSNMRSIWLCSRNDVLGNLAVATAALGVFGTGTRWPDLVVAVVMASLAITSAAQIVRLARQELRTGESTPAKCDSH